MEKSYIDIYRSAAAAFPVVRRVVENFNGKCYNCKLDKALQETVKKEIPGAYIYCKRENSKYISINFSVPGAHGSRGWITLCWVPEEKALKDQKRIDAAAIVDALREKRTALLKSAFEIEETGNHAEEIKQQLETLRNAYNKIVDSIPYEAREEYKIKCQHMY